MTKSLRSKLLIWILAAVILSALASYITAHLVMHRHDHDGHHGGHEEGNAEDLHQWMHDNLEISDAEWQKLEPFEKEFEKQQAELLNTIQEHGKTLAAAIRERDRESPEIKKAIDSINAAQSELQKITLDHFFVMKEHLTPDQANRLIEWTNESITRQHQR